MLHNALWLLRLMRPAHQVALVAIFCGVRYGIVRPWLETNFLQDPFPGAQFLILLAGGLLLSCGAVLINEYFDWQDDRIARPENVIVGRHLSRRTVIVWHGVLTTLGVLALCYLAFVWRNFYLLFLFPFVARVLWYYSKLYKQRLVFSVPLLFLFLFSAVLLPLLFEFLAINQRLWQAIVVNGLSVWNMLIPGVAYALLIALFGLTRAFEKQIRYYAQRTTFRTETLPDRIGVQPAKMVVLALKTVLFLLLFAVGASLYTQQVEVGWIAPVYLALFIGLPLVGSAVVGMGTSEQSPRWARFLTTVAALFVILFPLLTSVLGWFPPFP